MLSPLADRAAINSEIPARMSGQTIVVALSCELKSCPITFAL